MKKKFIKSLIVLLIFLSIVCSSILSFGSQIKDTNNVKVKELPTKFGLRFSAYICEIYSKKLYKDGKILGDAPGKDILTGGTWIPNQSYSWWAAEYGVNGSPIWKINTNGNYNLVTQNCKAVLSGLAYDPVSGKLYGCDVDKLYTINMSTGNAILIGDMNGRFFICMGINDKGQGYGIDTQTECLYKINLENASTTLVGPLGFYLKYAQDCEFDLNTQPNPLYIAAFDYATFKAEMLKCDIGTGQCTLLGTMPDGEWTAFAIPYGNQPPGPPVIKGPTHCKVGVIYTYNISLPVDPEGDLLYLRVDWGNGTIGKWLGPYSSGEIVRLTDKWDTQGNYTIRAQTKDSYGAESTWATLDVTIPRTGEPMSSLFLNLAKKIPIIQKLLQLIE